MTYKAEIQLKFDSFYTPDSCSRGITPDDDFLPEEHFLISAPAEDLNPKQYFKLFEKFMLSIGMDQQSICDGAMSLVFNGDRTEEEQRKVCEKYELTMNEDLESKYQFSKEAEAEVARIESLKNGMLSEEEWKRVDKLVEDSKID
jgi:hypothetical protein